MAALVAVSGPLEDLPCIDHASRGESGFLTQFRRGQDHYNSYQLSGVSGHGARSFYYPPQAKGNCAECHMPLRPSADFGSKDFDGSGEWTLEEKDGTTVATLDWRPAVNRPFIRHLTPVLRPLFRSNHNWAMRRGEQQIREYLDTTN